MGPGRGVERRAVQHCSVRRKPCHRCTGARQLHRALRGRERDPLIQPAAAEAGGAVAELVLRVRGRHDRVVGPPAVQGGAHFVVSGEREHLNVPVEEALQCHTLCLGSHHAGCAERAVGHDKRRGVRDAVDSEALQEGGASGVAGRRTASCRSDRSLQQRCPHERAHYQRRNDVQPGARWCAKWRGAGPEWGRELTARYAALCARGAA